MSGSLIWVVLQMRKGAIHPMSREALTAGRELAELTGGQVEAVLLGGGLEGDEAARCFGDELVATSRVGDADLRGLVA